MSGVTGPLLISVLALAGLIMIGWLLSAWLQDQYSVPLTGAEDNSGADGRTE